jgi:UPF0716 protein FxsA
MVAILVALFILVPLVEIAVIIQVGHWLGVLDTIALLLLVSIVGAWLVKRQGIGVLRRIRAELDAGRVPGAALVEGAVVLVAGVLLLTPGFVTDAFGLVLLVPPVRRLVVGRSRRRFSARGQWRRYRTSRRGPWGHPPELGE